MAPILKKTAKKPPKVKKTYQNAPGSEKMWFNVIKNAARNRAYQSFIRSFILYDRVSLRPEHIERVEEGNEVKVRWYTPNRAWYWEFFIGSHRDAIDSTLKTTIKEHEPYTYFIENAAREEYPDNWRSFIALYQENRVTVKEKLYEDEEETDFDTPAKKKLIRKIMHDWGVYMDNINSFILNNVGNIGINIPPSRYRRLLGVDIDTDITYKRVKFFTELYEKENNDIILAILRGIQQAYGSRLKTKNPDIVWENFMNFIVFFRREYIQHISYMVNNQGFTREVAVEEILRGTMEDLAKNIWLSNPNEVENLMRQLPDY